MKYLPLIITAFLILAACELPQTEESKAKELADQLRKQVTETTETTQPIAETPEETPDAPEQEVEETPEESESVEETVSPAQERTRVYKFLDIFASKVTSYEFEYKGDEYYAKGTRYKVLLENPVIVKDVSFGDTKKSLFYYDTVYVDRATKTAIAYCEGHKSQVNTQCTQLELYDLAYPVTFKEYDISLPEDWLLTYLDQEPIAWDENKYYINSRASITVRFAGDPEIELDFDPSSGLVMRADQKRGNQLVKRDDYVDLAINLVRDKDVHHRSKSEIPSSETFFR